MFHRIILQIKGLFALSVCTANARKSVPVQVMVQNWSDPGMDTMLKKNENPAKEK